MEARNWMFNAVAVITWCLMLKVGVSDPGINKLSEGCSNYNVSSVSNFNSNLNITFGLVRTDLMNSSKHFTTKQSLSGSDSVYAMFQCRDYMSEADCIACFSAASAQIRNCSVANGARVVYDGCFLRTVYSKRTFFDRETLLMSSHGFCPSFSWKVFLINNLLVYGSIASRFCNTLENWQLANLLLNFMFSALLRYERTDFYGETTRDANREYCGNQTTSTPDTTFNTTVAGLLGDLQVATPRINGFFAASKREVAGSNLSVHGIAQCVQTIDSAGCQACMEVAYKNIQKCPPKLDGRAHDAGCFMRYSDKPFFADNQTINLLPFLKTSEISSLPTQKSSSSSKKGVIIGGAAGGAALVLLIVGLFVWFKLSKKRKAAPRGNILDATELRGATIYSYKDLKLATKNFKEENKLGKGGFGDVYKGTLKNGKVVAVKKLALGHSNRVKADFASEVTLISNVHHRNLIRLLGCCNKGPELLLVYEYMANSSLDRFLFAPEYALHGQLSEKVDAYSFGIVVLEIAWKLYEDGRHIELVDETLDPSEYEAENAKKIIEIALMCTQSSPTSRPAMSEVVVLFKSRDSREHAQPTRSPFVEYVERVPGERSTSTASSSSNATASFSVLSAR
ncbi:hypothetical protein DKX38_027463 [Salix brachista]|uniref:Protein kinase domain-containing protein n=1 Tax=Salix brachista TaxID=2182728 RepID=A0A5N5JHC0_9ROSI|nr:hypothetical protein DKX38_027463 [Salix brachista]